MPELLIIVGVLLLATVAALVADRPWQSGSHDSKEK